MKPTVADAAKAARNGSTDDGDAERGTGGGGLEKLAAGKHEFVGHGTLLVGLIRWINGSIRKCMQSPCQTEKRK